MTGFVIDIVDLPHQAGSVKDIRVGLPAPRDLGTDVIGVPEGETVEIDAFFTSVDDGVLVQGSAIMPILGECVRCLTEIREERSVHFRELYFLPQVRDALAREGDDEADDVLVLADTTLDLEPVVRDALVLDLPFQPLCTPDCPGLCQECGERLADLPQDHHHEILDPRWASLGALVADMAQTSPIDEVERSS